MGARRSPGGNSQTERTAGGLRKSHKGVEPIRWTNLLSRRGRPLASQLVRSRRHHTCRVRDWQGEKSDVWGSTLGSGGVKLGHGLKAKPFGALEQLTSPR